MRVDGFHSWRLAVSGADDLSFLALYVREAVRLAPPADSAIPPPLRVTPPDRSEVLTDDERDQASEAWQGWWRDILGYQARLQGPPDDAGDFTDWVRFNSAERAAIIGDVPDFEALSDRPALRRAVTSLFMEAHAAQCAPRVDGAAGEPQISWAVVREAAEEVSARHRVPIGDVQGVVIVLPVQGTWWCSADAGEVVCSDACLVDDATAGQVVRGAFTSGLVR